MKLKTKDIVLIVLSALALVAFFAILILVCVGYNFNIDNFNILVADNRTSFLTYFFKVFTYLGSSVMLILIVVILFFAIKDKKIGITLAVGFVLSAIVVVVVKYLVMRDRPLDLMMVEEIGYSFPSAHAMLSITVYGIIMYFVLTKLNNRTIKIALTILFSIIILLVGFSRIYLGVHYTTDVISGYLLGFCIVVASIYIYKLICKIWQKKIDKNLEDSEQTKI